MMMMMTRQKIARLLSVADFEHVQKFATDSNLAIISPVELSLVESGRASGEVIRALLSSHSVL